MSASSSTTTTTTEYEYLARVIIHDINNNCTQICMETHHDTFKTDAEAQQFVKKKLVDFILNRFTNQDPLDVPYEPNDEDKEFFTQHLFKYDETRSAWYMPKEVTLDKLLEVSMHLQIKEKCNFSHQIIRCPVLDGAIWVPQWTHVMTN